MPCDECKKSDTLQRLANELIGLSEDDITNLNCLIAGNKVELVRC